MQNKVRAKTITHCTVENSMRSAFSFVMTAISTHFILRKSLSDTVHNQFLFRAKKQSN